MRSDSFSKSVSILKPSAVHSKTREEETVDCQSCGLLYESAYPGFKNIPAIHDVWVSEEVRSKGKSFMRYLEKMARSQIYKKIGLGAT